MSLHALGVVVYHDQPTKRFGPLHMNQVETSITDEQSRTRHYHIDLSPCNANAAALLQAIGPHLLPIK